jgi:hypothetical protein
MFKDNKLSTVAFLSLLIYGGNSLFADENQDKINQDIQSLMDEQKTEDMKSSDRPFNPLKRNSLKIKNSNSSEVNPITDITWKPGEIITLQVEYAHPTKVVMPGYIEKLEYLEGVGGITINKKNFAKGEDSMLITREQNIDKDTVVYATVLGKRLTFIIKYADINQGHSLVKINIPVENSVEAANSVNSTPQKVYKKIKSKDLTRETNIKSVGMLVHMLKGDAPEYYAKIDLNRKLKKENDSFFSFGNKKEDNMGELVFKSLFENNPYFLESYQKRLVKPIELYEDNFIVVYSDVRREKMDIYGLKMELCNYDKNEAMSINIDDIKTIIGKNILAAKHPMEKVAPMTCEDAYVVFYKKMEDKNKK